jgi:hypothetical protein
MKSKKIKKMKPANIRPKLAKREKVQAAEMSPHIAKILDQELTDNQDFYLTFNCLCCHGIFTSVVQRGEIVEHLCTSAGNKNARQEIRPRGKASEIQALQVAVV